MKTIKSGIAMLKVLESWGVDHVYGMPGCSINSTMDALYEMRDSVKYIQVRHEEVGVIAAAVDAKLTGKIGVCFGSAGPGATHLFNGLYDTKMDKVPLLALIGEDLPEIFNTARDSTAPVVIDVKIENKRPFPAEAMVLDPKIHGKSEIEAFRKRYEVGDMPLLQELL